MMGTLPLTSARPAVRYDYFPTQWQAVLWRNLAMAPLDRIARVLGTDEATLRQEAGALGLDAHTGTDPAWLTRGYLTVIRENFHLLSFEGICTLLDITAEHLAFLLKEDDFLWHKMGQIKPAVPDARYRPLDERERARTRAIRQALEEALPHRAEHRENAFRFMDEWKHPVGEEERAQVGASLSGNRGLRTVYSYFALYGDPLIDPSLDPFPDALLCAYAKAGVRGVWLQGVLYQLTLFPFAPTLSQGWERRIETLNDLIRRAARFGIGVYLYLNEPRAMDDAFYEAYPSLRGTREGDFYAMCTSTPEVQAYLQNATRMLFQQAKGLAGFFTISMSENLTNCYSRSDGSPLCPRCAARDAGDVVAEVNNLMARGMRDAAPDARAIVWTWGWGNGWVDKLTENQIVQCTSEEDLATCVGGISGHVLDYSISQVGPGEKSKAAWRTALARGHEVCAKVQINNTWELSAIPYLPVFDKIALHIGRLKDAGVRHLQLSWTLGGYPSPNLRLACGLMDGGGSVASFLEDWLGEELAPVADAGQQKLSQAFSQFPFHINTVYTAPMNYAPMAPFFMEPTGWKATMIGFPYDDLDTWRAIYPRDVFLRQFELLCEGWEEGCALLRPHRGKSGAFDELLTMAEAALCHFESTRNHIRFVMARDTDRDKALAAVRDERGCVLRTIRLRLSDSRLGYEASNHYYYTLHDLYEKLVNLAYCEEALLAPAGGNE